MPKRAKFVAERFRHSKSTEPTFRVSCKHGRLSERYSEERGAIE